MKFQMSFNEKQLRFTLEGEVTADIMNARRQLDSEIIRNFLSEADGMQDIMRQCNMANLMRLRNLLLAYLTEQFPSYKISGCFISWEHGPDTLSLS